MHNHDTRKKVLGFFLVLLGLALGLAPKPSPAAAAAQEVYFTILHTNDEHSALIPSPLVEDHPTEYNPSLGGFARLAGAVGEIRAEKDETGEAVLLLSAGDYLGGSAFSWLALEGLAPELSLMKALGYDVVTIGNHEYDYGPDVLAQYLEAAGYPAASERTVIVASNTHPPEGHPLGAMGLRDTWLMEIDSGLKMGFLGLIGKDAIQVAPYASPVEFSSQEERAREKVEKLVEAGADIVIAISHSGVEEDRLLARAVPGIDIIVGGHCHTLLEAPLVEGETIIVQAGQLLQHLGILELAYNPDSGKLRVRNHETGRPHTLPLDFEVPADLSMAAMVETYRETLNHRIRHLTGQRFQNLEETIVYTSFTLDNKPPLQESPLGNFITDAMRLKAQEALGEKVDFAFQANGVIRGALVPGSLTHSRDRVSLYDMIELVGLGSGPDGQPGYPLVSVYLTGEEVRRVLEISILLSEIMGDTYFLQMSGLRKTFDPSRAILLWVPIKNIPVPTSRAVLTAERYTGDAIQGDGAYVPLNRGDETLYHVVTDYYIASFLPMVGEMLPGLALEPKDKRGHPVDIEDALVTRQGQEFKVWQAVVEYASDQPPGDDGNPRIPQSYNQATSRIIPVKTVPFLLWAGLAFALLLILLLLYVRRRKKGSGETYLGRGKSW